MHSGLPDYGDFQCCGLGVDGVLSQLARKIYSKFRKPSWQTSKHHLLMAKITKKLPKEFNVVSENDKRAISNRKGSSAE